MDRLAWLLGPHDIEDLFYFVQHREMLSLQLLLALFACSANMNNGVEGAIAGRSERSRGS
jgi:hypothetical protein